MLFVDNQGVTDPRLNLALEEYLLRRLETDQDILLFYINEPSIIIGRNQNTLEEINREVVEARGVHVVRRLSGGGAVYHDLGNLNFSFISDNNPENFHNFKKFTAPVIRVLQEMGVPAELSGRNDILADGRKISGNAQYIAARRMVSHGTLLFDSDLEHVAEMLRVKANKIESKGIKSVRSRVANICEFLPEPMTIEAFRAHLLQGIFHGSETVESYVLTPEDWQGAEALADERYRRWEWNFGRSPAFNVQKVHRFPFGEVDARIDVQHGRILAARFFGDFLSRAPVSDLEERLVGRRYDRADLLAAMAGVDLSQYFNGLEIEEFIEFLAV